MRHPTGESTAKPAAGFTHPEVGATRDRVLPAGYRHVHRDVPVGTGREAFVRAADGLLGWRMHRGAGLAVTATGRRAVAGAVVLLHVGRAPLRLTVPCRVVYVVDAPDQRGFAYGTLPGHPEQGEELFTVRLTRGGDVRVRIRAFSRPATALARAGGPVTHLVQEYVTDRYLRALRRLAGGGDARARR
ncbi:hypothetical protein AWW66_10785 [Micromonospora rosaria]|uniref:DUF1990 domain-containing protein n=1 Tax=Micromonospora rosaria TaxID=47874 RepID=A0A136PU96_9ACTN|nr:DUF1990 domain-containing protein [Micromonospora rosaria]KXK62018.1 hypothetical protein AWW66_10785 [Micromonospora rosaria]